MDNHKAGVGGIARGNKDDQCQKAAIQSFLGLRYESDPKQEVHRAISPICDKSWNWKAKLVEQARARNCRPSGKRPLDNTRLYNSVVLGIQNYFQLATRHQH